MGNNITARIDTPGINRNPLSRGGEWTFELLHIYDEAIADIAHNEFGLDTFANQIEVIASEQMLDAYATTGLPIAYPHWSYGKQFIANSEAYRRGQQGLAYEIVINSDPCIAYLMEDNTLPMQALVIAHACYGHNSFFKGNYLFQQWTSPDGIIDYMVFARNYILECEERYGIDAVEDILDACHALMNHGVDRYHHPSPLSSEAERIRQLARDEYNWKRYDDIWRTVPNDPETDSTDTTRKHRFPQEPQENLLYFIEKNSPILEGWQREIVRIVRKVAQYFYPQGLTKVMNEGWATFWHYTLLNRLYDKGLADDGFMLEVLQSHTNVVSQLPFNHRHYSGINPYALGFSMMRDIRRICEHPDEEDRLWFPDIAGGDWLEVMDFAMRNFKDESFIAQYLSPKLIREFHLFAVADRADDSELTVSEIHNDQGYREIRRLLSKQYNRDLNTPDIQIVNYNYRGDRSLQLEYRQQRNRPLNEAAKEVMKHMATLWGFPVSLNTLNAEGTQVDTLTVNAPKFAA
jgi:stage V sporulation protein R